MLVKTIRLHPSQFECDIIVTETSEGLKELSMKRYGMVEEQDVIHINECSYIYTGINSDLKGIKRFVICIESLDDIRVVVHESLHLLWQYGEATKCKITTETQEWQCIFFEDIIDQILDKTGYSEAFRD